MVWELDRLLQQIQYGKCAKEIVKHECGLKSTHYDFETSNIKNLNMTDRDTFSKWILNHIYFQRQSTVKALRDQ